MANTILCIYTQGSIYSTFLGNDSFEILGHNSTIHLTIPEIHLAHSFDLTSYSHIAHDYKAHMQFWTFDAHINFNERVEILSNYFPHCFLFCFKKDLLQKWNAIRVYERKDHVHTTQHGLILEAQSDASIQFVIFNSQHN
jgi:hypothetical protein